MQLTVKGQQLDVGDALRTYIDDSLSTILDKYFGDALDVDVTLSRQGHRYRAVVAAHVGRGINLEAQGEADEPYPAFDTAAERLSTRLRRHKRRLRARHKNGSIEEENWVAQSYILSAEGSDSEDDTEGSVSENGQSMVVAEMTTEIPSLTVSEAVMRMDLGDLPALMFRNEAHGGLNMIYRRKDDNIGWIDPRGNRGT